MIRRRASAPLATLLGAAVLVAACGTSARQRALEGTRPSELVDLALLDPTLTIELRYATAENFLGRPVYPPHARAFLQRPAAEALLRANAKLADEGVALLVLDAYRPLSVTQLFWDLTPREKREFVANPREGSRHNRGCAVDVTLLDLASGRELAMPSDWDEFTERAHPDYPGGTDEERANRDLLRRTMESEGFTVYENEWWHFDFRDWAEYPVMDEPVVAP